MNILLQEAYIFMNIIDKIHCITRENSFIFLEFIINNLINIF